jgi:hypothetical protein
VYVFDAAASAAYTIDLPLGTFLATGEIAGAGLVSVDHLRFGGERDHGAESKWGVVLRPSSGGYSHGGCAIACAGGESQG